MSIMEAFGWKNNSICLFQCSFYSIDQGRLDSESKGMV